MARRSDPGSRLAAWSRLQAPARRAGQRLRALCAEPLEDRRLLSVVAALPAGVRAQPTFEIHLLGTLHAAGASAPSGGLTPSQIRGAYGLDSITFQDVQGDGAGQTIAIVDAYDDPNALNDLNAFSTQFSLPQFNTSGGPTFQKLDENGGSSLPPTDPNGPYSSTNKGTWEIEESLDIEWAHVMAPMANIILFEAADAGSGLYDRGADGGGNAGRGCGLHELERKRIRRRRRLALHHAVGPSRRRGDDGRRRIAGRHHLSGQRRRLWGLHFQFRHDHAAIPGQFAQRGRRGRNQLVPRRQRLRQRDRLGQRHEQLEHVANGGGGGGSGISSFEPQPSYQIGVVNAQTSISTTNRTYPDVSADANPYTGVPIYDSYDYGASTPWVSGTLGGTSLACPLWAGMIAVADQGRAIAGLGSLDGPSSNPARACTSCRPPISTTSSTTVQPTRPPATRCPARRPVPAPCTARVRATTWPPAWAALSATCSFRNWSQVLPAAWRSPRGRPAGLPARAISPTITVDVEDASGNLVATDNSSVTLSIGSNPTRRQPAGNANRGGGQRRGHLLRAVASTRRATAIP